VTLLRLADTGSAGAPIVVGWVVGVLLGELVTVLAVGTSGELRPSCHACAHGLVGKTCAFGLAVLGIGGSALCLHLVAGCDCAATLG